MGKMNRWETNWEDMPNIMTLDELMVHPLFSNYIEKYGKWQILLSNGVFYTGTIGGDGIAYKCRPESVLDRVFIH
jgi:hypothetical protein